MDNFAQTLDRFVKMGKKSGAQELLLALADELEPGAFLTAEKVYRKYIESIGTVEKAEVAV